jgi:hypothetical protein
MRATLGGRAVAEALACGPRIRRRLDRFAETARGSRKLQEETPRDELKKRRAKSSVPKTW